MDQRRARQDGGSRKLCSSHPFAATTRCKAGDDLGRPPREDLHVRSWRGSAWFHGLQDRREGHIGAGGAEQEVVFVEAETASTTRSTPPTA
jgi:hypothetical protein